MPNHLPKWMNQLDSGNKTPGFGWFAVVVCIWCVPILFIDGFVASQIRTQWKTDSFAETVGTVTHSSVEIHCGDEGCSYSPKILYDYSVDGKKFSGKTFKYTPLNGLKESARRLTLEHPVGREVPVFYDPNNSKRSVLRRGIDAEDFRFYLFLAPFNATVLLGLYGLMKIQYRSLVRNPEHWFHDLPMRDDGLTLRLKVGTNDPIATGMVVMTAAGLVLMATSFVCYRDDCDGRHLLCCLGIVVASFLLGCLLAARWNKSDRYELTVDRERNELILPRQPNGSNGPVVPFGDIESFDIQVVSAKNDDDTEEHRLTVDYRKFDEIRSGVIASKYNRITFFHFRDDAVEIKELKTILETETALISTRSG